MSDTAASSTRTIVVGVDGSDGSKSALRWAIAEARLHGAKVVAVAAWEFPYIYAGPGDMVPLLPWKDQAPEMVDMLSSEIADAVGDSGVEVEARVEEGPASRVLLDASKDAELLVVGSRGRGGFSGLLLGSVSMQCAHHAACPVVIIPHPRGH